MKLILERHIIAFVCLFLLISIVQANGANVYRLKDYLGAKEITPQQRYQIIFDTHRKAIANNTIVSYEGIDSLYMEIPKYACAIPIKDDVDFKGLKIRVLNNSQNQFLFDLRAKTDTIVIRNKDIDKGDFSSYEPLKVGKHILIISDKNLWVNQRYGHDYGHVRKDILYIESGKAKNKVVSSYDNRYSSPTCVIVSADKTTELKNLTIIRDSKSQFLTTCFIFQNLNDICIRKMKILTPGNPNKLVADRAFAFYNCTNLVMEDVSINGSYSLANKSGYGIFMNNVWNCQFIRLYGHGEWGIFGNKNVSQPTLRNCDINRFDIHCYGKDVSCYDCKFSNHYNQYSGVYGIILYDHCQFDNFSPYINGGSYDAHVPVKIVLKDCTWLITKKKHFIVEDRKPFKDKNPRKELKKKYTPVVVIENLKTYTRDDRVVKYVKYKESEYKD